MKIFWGLPYLIWTAICISIAILYIFLVPKISGSTFFASWQKLILKYAHSMVWILLAIASVLTGNECDLSAKIMSLLSLALYILFIYTLVKAKFDERKRVKAE